MGHISGVVPPHLRTTTKMFKPTFGEIYQIFFLLKGEDISRVSVTRGPGWERICNIQRAIKRQRMSALSGVDPGDIDLYIAPMPKGSHNALHEFYLQLDRNEHQKLSGTVRIADAFPEPSTQDFLVVFKPQGELRSKGHPCFPLIFTACHLSRTYRC